MTTNRLYVWFEAWGLAAVVYIIITMAGGTFGGN